MHENDQFDHGVINNRQFLTFVPAKIERGNVIGYFAATWAKSGEMTAVVYKTIKELDEQHRSRSRAKESGPWVTDTDAMYKKTVLRLTAKLNPYSTSEIHEAVALDEKADLDMPQNLHLLADQGAIAITENQQPLFTEPKRLSGQIVASKATFVPTNFRVESAKNGQQGRPKTLYIVEGYRDIPFVTTDKAIGELFENATKKKQAITVSFTPQEDSNLVKEAVVENK